MIWIDFIYWNLDFIRGTDPPDDIKTALDKAKKMYGKDFGSFKSFRPDQVASCDMNEEVFLETGGVVGYIERGRILVKKGNYKAANMWWW